MSKEKEIDTFRCEHCLQVFPKEWSDDEAKAEYDGQFNELAPETKEDKAVVCDDCYQKFMEWYINKEEGDEKRKQSQKK